jgi:CSLREA domain-containing protein
LQPKFLVCALGALLVLLLAAQPAMAAVGPITVNSLEDSSGVPGEEVCTGGDGVNCTLREAINTANANAGEDTISFAGIPAGSLLEIDEVSLPTIEEKVTIDGHTAAGASAEAPAIELLPINMSAETFTTGFAVHGGSGTRIEGFAIGGFSAGIEVAFTGSGEGEGTNTAADDTEICGNYLGTDLSGELDEPNITGAEVWATPTAEQPQGTVVGSPGAGCPGNVISANSRFGVADYGLGTTVAGNSIGIGAQPNGAILPNGTAGAESPGAGVDVDALASGTMIGGTAPSGVEANFIAFNHGPGVLVEGWSGNVSIRHDSILENEGLGIQILSDEKLEPPTIAVARSPAAGRVELAGTVNGSGEEEVELDFYGSPTCGEGEGLTYLGSERFPIESGGNPYGSTLFVNVPDDDTAITATSTKQAGATTEFSACATYEPPPPPEPGSEPSPEQKAPSGGGTPPPPASPITNAVTPSNGETIVVKPEEGKVKIKLPGTKKYVPLEELKEIPVGAVIDATKGKVTLTSISPDGTEQSANFFGGVFKVKQKEGSGLVVLELLDTGVCPATGSSLGGGLPNVLARAGKGTSGKLWGSGHGNFKTEGNQGSATVRGTVWLVEDRCDGTTFFKTRRGVVSVRDFFLGKTVSLPAGKSYVAGEG